MIKLIASTLFAICMLAFASCHAAVASSEFSFDGCIIQVPVGFEKIERTSTSIEFTNFENIKAQSILVDENHEEYFKNSFSHMPTKLLGEFESPRIKAVLFDFIGERETQNIRFLVIESENKVMVLINIEKLLVSAMVEDCLFSFEFDNIMQLFPDE